MNEVNFLERIRQRPSSPLSHPGNYPVPARHLPDDLTAEFCDRLTAVGGHVYQVTDAAEARVVVRDILEGRGVDLAYLSHHDILIDLEIDKLLGRLGVKLVELGEAGKASVTAVAQAQVGLTGVEYAVAASGTLGMAASPFHLRTASLLPPLHIAVVRQNQLLPDLASLAVRLGHDFPRRLPSGLALITGPSRTADIEQTLSIGVHGPAEVHVVLVAGA